MLRQARGEVMMLKGWSRKRNHTCFMLLCGLYGLKRHYFVFAVTDENSDSESELEERSKGRFP